MRTSAWSFVEPCKKCSKLELFTAPYVIWGTGRVDQAFYRTYCAPEGKKPIFWVDSNAAKHGSRIAARPLDDVLQGAACTLLKMDIEGAEYNALLGAAKTIEQHRPKLVVCVYHSLEDYVRIPELLMERYPFYRFFLRQHSATSGETVLYAL